MDTQFETAYDFNTLPQSTCTLYTKWTPVEYTINYVLNGGTNNDSNPATYTVEDAVMFAAPSKTGYTFNGWYSNAQYTGALVEGITSGSHGEITVYASFSVNEYTISFNTNGGTTVAAITQNYGTEVTTPASSSKTGYRFAGWYADAELNMPYAFTAMPAEDITVYAKWTIVEYEIVYNLDGGTNNESNPATYTVEDAVTFAAPSKLGYSAALTARRVGQRKAVLTSAAFLHIIKLTSAAFLHIIKSISTEGTMSDEGDSDSNAAAPRQYGKQNKT